MGDLKNQEAAIEAAQKDSKKVDGSLSIEVETEKNKVAAKAEEEGRAALLAAKKEVEKAEVVIEKVQPLKQNECIEIIALKQGDEKSDLVLTMDLKDMYAPKRTGVFNVSMKKRVTGAASAATAAQHWFFNARTQGIHSKLMPTKVLLEGGNKNVILYTFRRLGAQKFAYDEINQVWKNKASGNALMLKSTASFEKDANLVAGKFTNDLGQRFAF